MERSIAVRALLLSARLFSLNTTTTTTTTATTAPHSPTQQTRTPDLERVTTLLARPLARPNRYPPPDSELCCTRTFPTHRHSAPDKQLSGGNSTFLIIVLILGTISERFADFG